jgi:solute carrier family 35 protein C2
MVMQKSEMGLANPIDMMYHIQPWMIVTLLPFAMAFEGTSSYCSILQLMILKNFLIN